MRSCRTIRNDFLNLFLLSTSKSFVNWRKSFVNQSQFPSLVTSLRLHVELMNQPTGIDLLTLSRDELLALPASERWIRIHGEIDVIYSDECIVVCNKPSGLLTVPGITVKDSLVSRVAVAFGQDRIDKMVVHRLDQATSGLLIFARTEQALKKMNENFRTRKIKKKYISVVNGIMDENDGVIDMPIRRDMEKKPLQCVDMEKGKKSITQWKVIARDIEHNTTRVELIPVTGRSHQLRIHMKHIGHPILGDKLYADEEALGKAPRCLLHAWELEFKHPITEDDMLFKVEPDF